MKGRINKWVDLVDRGAWTAIQTSLGVIGATAIDGHLDWKLVGIACALATAGSLAKTMGAQKLGESGLGDAVPGASVVDPPKKS